jgi:hypothetical protein
MRVVTIILGSLAMMIAGCDRSVSIDEVAPERVEEERAPVLEPLEVPAKLPGREGAAVDVVVDLLEPESGKMKVEMTFGGLSSREFVAKGEEGEFKFSNLVVRDAAGEEIGYEKDERVYRLERDSGELFQISYEVRPGGEGRHGNQGAVTEEFALFDGRVYILPKNGAALETVRVRFDAPEGWVVASPFREDGEWWVLDGYEPSMAVMTLTTSCVGVGPFDLETAEFGGTDFRVFSYSDWSEKHKRTLAAKSKRLFRWFHEELGFETGAPYAVIWTPQSKGPRVFGGSAGNGTGFQHPIDMLRNWQLFAHRAGHGINHYLPNGMLIRDARDKWFNEGWASYVEVIATEASGLAKDESHFNTLYRSYHKVRRKYPAYDIALADEPEADRYTTEFIHYAKGPLVVRMLDAELQRRSGKTLTEFMKLMWGKYGRYQAAFPLRDELAEFSGESMDDFWAAVVDRKGAILPLWRGGLPEDLADVTSEGPAGYAGETEISCDYLFALAESGEFESFAEIVAFLAEEEGRRFELEALGVEPFATKGLGVPRKDLPGVVRYDLARHEAAIGESVGLSMEGREDLERVGVRFVREHRDGRTFARLLSQEAAYVDNLSRAGVSRLSLRTESAGGTDLLGIEEGTSGAVRINWVQPPVEYELRVVEDGMVTARRSAEAMWYKTYSFEMLGEELRPKDGDIITVEIENGGESMARSFWYRREADKGPAEEDEAEEDTAKGDEADKDEVKGESLE